jgi:hypothetical protein
MLGMSVSWVSVALDDEKADHVAAARAALELGGASALIQPLVKELAAGLAAFDRMSLSKRSGGVVESPRSPRDAHFSAIAPALRPPPAPAVGLTYAWTIAGRSVRLRFFCYGMSGCLEVCRSQARCMYAWLRMALRLAPQRCAEKLSATIYMVDAPRQLPASSVTVLGPDHVNGGLSYVCARNGEITIYRAEEFGKVFVHETFHALGLDQAGREGGESSDIIAQAFRLPADAELAEAYTESWATIISALLSSLTGGDDALTALAKEQVFAAGQAAKVLAHMGLPTSVLADDSEQASVLRRLLYKQETPVFAYYLARAALLAALPAFLRTCKDENLGTIKLREGSSPHSWVAELCAGVGASGEFARFADKCAFDQRGALATTMRMTAAASP